MDRETGQRTNGKGDDAPSLHPARPGAGSGPGTGQLGRPEPREALQRLRGPQDRAHAPAGRVPRVARRRRRAPGRALLVRHGGLPGRPGGRGRGPARRAGRCAGGGPHGEGVEGEPRREAPGHGFQAAARPHHRRPAHRPRGEGDGAPRAARVPGGHGCLSRLHAPDHASDEGGVAREARPRAGRPALQGGGEAVEGPVGDVRQGRGREGVPRCGRDGRIVRRAGPGRGGGEEGQGGRAGLRVGAADGSGTGPRRRRPPEGAGESAREGGRRASWC